ncbi:helix-turn-helix transcriptional regulator, partial [Candidatus Pantoea gossypiicola]
MKISLQQWVESERSIASAARKLGVNATTLSAYCRGDRYPRADMMMTLLEKLSDEVDFHLLLSKRAEKSKARVLCKRRQRNNILVNNLSKLKKIFEEQTLRFEVDEKQTELILCRWKTTNVTVGEVRSALEKL